MNFFKSAPKTFNILSIGLRGSGKTVFLAGSYAELRIGKRTTGQKLWFDCLDKQAQENIEKLLVYVSRTGQYPPPTLKVTNFSFSAKRRGLLGESTLCDFNWWDVPGESCSTRNPEFQKMLLSSHGCCIFVSADALVYDKTYLRSLDGMLKQLEAMASLINQSGIPYLFALILTKCDLLESGPIGLLQIEENLQPLAARLEAAGVNYQRFYSAIPIVAIEGIPTLKAAGAAAPLQWMSSELAKIYRFQPQQDLAGGFKRLISRPGRAVSSKANAAPSAGNNFVTWGLGGIGVAALLTAAVVGIINLTKPSGSAITAQANQRIQEYQSVLEREPNNANALINLATTFIENEKYSDAIPLMEKLVALEPGNLDLRFQLASLFELTGNKAKEEEVYDQLLVQQPDNLKALLRKATLRGLQGDAQTAQKLFAQAEKVAPTSDLKGRVREVAQTVLKPGGSSQN